MVTFNLHAPLSRLEQKKGRRYNFAEIADIAGQTRQNIRRMLKGGTKQIDVATLGALLKFFEHEGMPISIADLFTISTDSAPDQT